MSALLDVIMPVFLVIGAGWLAARAGLFPDSNVDGLMRFAQTFAVPALLFMSIARLDLSAAYDTGLFLSFYTGAFAAFGLGILGARLLGRAGPDSVAIGFACLFSNSLLLGLPITERAYGAGALTANYAIISIHSPLLYAAGITVMELTLNHGQGLPPARLARKVLRAIFTQPMVLGICAGFAVNLGGLPLPGFGWSAIRMLGSAAIPTALFGLGGVLYRYRPEGDSRAIAMVMGLSLILHPVTAWLLGRHIFEISTEQLRSAVITGAMAPGVNAYLFAHMYGVAKRVNASAVLLATAASVLTTWGWLAVLP